MAAAGTISCAMVAAMPISRLASSRMDLPGQATAEKKQRQRRAFIRINVLRSWRSPSGSRNRMPSA
jgi:hypothetical protein